MSDINTCTISGRLGADPEVKHHDDKAYCSVKVAVGGWNSKDREETTHWCKLTVSGQKAEYIGKFAKGDSIVFAGAQWGYDDWENRDGKMMHTHWFKWPSEVKMFGKKAREVERQSGEAVGDSDEMPF